MDRPKLKNLKPQIKYDDFSDVLYISFGNPSPGIADEIVKGDLIRINPITNEIVGITILDFKERYKPKQNINMFNFVEKLIPKILNTYTF